MTASRGWRSENGDEKLELAVDIDNVEDTDNSANKAYLDVLAERYSASLRGSERVSREASKGVHHKSIDSNGGVCVSIGLAGKGGWPNYALKEISSSI